MSELRNWFADPPKKYSPAPIWWWSGDRLDPKRLRWELERFAEGEVYNLIVLNLAPTGPLYGSDADNPRFFSDEWWRIFRGVCEDARELGIYLWFYDQIGFSGANIQGELARRNPEYAGKTLERVFQDTNDSCELECPGSGTAVGAAAIPIDDEGRPAGAPQPLPVANGRVEWRGQGRHRVMLFYAVDRGYDYFNPAACDALLDTVHGQYEQRSGEFFGNVIVGSFQDELPSMPAWSDTFADEFKRLRDYDLMPHLAALWEEYGEESDRVRRDYHATRADLAETAFFKPLFHWHESRGLICGFDQQGPARAGYPVQCTSLYADYLRTHRWYDAPGSDHHGEAKIHSSLAHLYDRPRVWIESFHSSGWGGTIEETYDWLLPWIRAGANLYNPHAVYYSTHGGWWEWAPPSTDWRQPYWKHYSRFSRAVTRLCSLLSLGHHVCDVGILYPTTTVQSDLKLDGPGERASAAHDAYLSLVGKMIWYDVQKGIMDGLCRDYDVLDDDSVQRGTVRDGQLVIGRESYSILVLPSCTVIDAQTAKRLVEFVQGGGRLIAFGEVPAQIAGEDPESARAFLSMFDSGTATQVRSEDELAERLREVAPSVEAEVPTLVRRVDGQTLVFVPATFPRATRMASEDDRSRGVSWIELGYSFDPERYSRSSRVKVSGVRGEPMVLEPFSGKARSLQSTEDESGVEVEVEFSDGPGVLLLWGEGTGEVSESSLAYSDEQVISRQSLEDAWGVDLVPTLDNTWGDFALPVRGKSVPLERWEFRHATERPGTADSDAGWRERELDDQSWDVAYATFGPHGEWTGPAAPADLPDPGGPADASQWRPALYSLSRGIHKDPLHHRTLGPKGHVPEEFLNFGQVAAGEAVQFRATVRLRSPERAFFALGAPAAKQVWINGQSIPDQAGYLLMAQVDLQEGDNRIEFRLTAEHDTNLRAHFAFVEKAESYRRPEWIQAGGESEQDARLSFHKSFDLDFDPGYAMVQVGATVPCRLRVNGVEIGRQGGYEPYFSPNQTRVQPYEIMEALQQGENEIELELIELDPSASAFVDCLIRGDGGRLSVITDGTWEVHRDGRPVPLRIRRQQHLDPAHSHLWRRQHPLPETSWLETDQPESSTVLPLVPGIPGDEGQVEWIRFTLPPGAVRMSTVIYGAATVYVDGEEVSAQDETRDSASTTLNVRLPHPDRTGRVCAIRVETVLGFRGGAVLAAPLRFETSKGKLGFGDWQELGLAGYSGGVTYTKTVRLARSDHRFLLDLGRVRGTAEVEVNGKDAGTRIWSPYVFDVTDLVTEGDNELRVTVYNTLGPYIYAVSPSHYVFSGQKTSGILGPTSIVEVREQSS